MSRNIEIKAQIENVEALVKLAAAIASNGPVEIAQDDTFFRCESGRLKLRAFSDGTGELIFYRRANGRGPKESFYIRSPTPAPDSLRDSLSLAYGQIGRVIKHRTLFIVGRTRIHLDNVEKLGIEPHQLVGDAYIDLITRRLTGGSSGLAARLRR